MLYVSGYTNDAFAHNTITESSISFLQKPLRPSVLVRKVRDVLDGSH